jgi:hypothetical protein
VNTGSPIAIRPVSGLIPKAQHEEGGQMKKAIIISLILLASRSYSQSLQEFQDEIIQIKNKTNTSQQTVWWIPSEYWKMCLSGSVKQNELDAFVKSVDHYAIFCISMTTANSRGVVSSVCPDSIERHVRLLLEDGRVFLPIPRKKKTRELLIASTKFNPIFERLGSTSKTATLIAFENDKTKKPMLRTTDRTNFSIQLYDQEFKWKLPLVCLLPRKYCTQCRNDFEGDFLFCPFDKSTLVTVDKKQ